MTFYLIISATMNWLASQLAPLTLNLETTTLEFILLGRIPATDVYLQFESVVVIALTAVMALGMRVLLYNPYPTD